MKTPKTPLGKEAREHFSKKVKHMQGQERKKMEKRLEMYDRGFRGKEEPHSTDGFVVRRKK